MTFSVKILFTSSPTVDDPALKFLTFVCLSEVSLKTSVAGSGDFWLLQLLSFLTEFWSGRGVLGYYAGGVGFYSHRTLFGRTQRVTLSPSLFGTGVKLSTHAHLDLPTPTKQKLNLHNLNGSGSWTYCSRTRVAVSAERTHTDEGGIYW